MSDPKRREFLKAALAAMATASVTGCKPKEPVGITCYLVVIDHPTDEQSLKRAELVKRLEALAESKTPSNLELRPSCYDMAPPPYKEMPCSVCERTMEVGKKDEIFREYNVPLKRIQDQGVNAKLILPEHCPECGFGLEHGKFQLEIQYPDQQEPVRVALEFFLDLEIMALFLQGSDRYTEWLGSDKPLKDKVERLKELFGVAEE